MLRFVFVAFLRLLICTLFIFAVWLSGFAWFLSKVPHTAANDKFTTDAIVVLTGGKGRIDYGLKLLSEKRASRLFISGVEDRVTPDALDASHGRLLHDFSISGGTADDSSAVVMLGYDARNTIGNAMETTQWMRRQKLKSLRLVTTNYHMPRALSEFHFLMPDVTILPDPVIPEDLDMDHWWESDVYSHILFSEYHKLVAAMLRHQLISYTGDTL